MLDAEFTKYLVSLGVGGIIAVLIYHYSSREVKAQSEARISDAKMYQDKILALHDVEKGRTDKLVDVIKENSTQTAVNTEVLKSLHRRLDKDADAKTITNFTK